MRLNLFPSDSCSFLEKEYYKIHLSSWDLSELAVRLNVNSMDLICDLVRAVNSDDQKTFYKIKNIIEESLKRKFR